MKKIYNTPIHNSLCKNIIEGMLFIWNNCMSILEKSAHEEVRETNNNYFVYMTYLNFIKECCKYIDTDYYQYLLTDAQKEEIKESINKINSWSQKLNISVKKFNEREKTKGIFDRSHLKLIKELKCNFMKKEYN